MTTPLLSRPGFLFRFRRCIAVVVLLGLACTSVFAADPELKFVLILSRHGVRSPLPAQQGYGKFAAQEWPKWNVPAGHLTPHGRRQMELMGAYYRESLVAAGLLSGDAKRDAASIYLRANNEQRTIESARALGEALAPGQDLPVSFRPAGESDPVFRPARVPLGPIDRDLAVAAVLGRVGGDINGAGRSQSAAFAALNQILLGDPARARGKEKLLDQPATVAPGQGEDVITIRGPLSLGASMVDSFMLQYSEGLPMSDVAWGRLAHDDFPGLLAIHALYYDLRTATFEIAQVQMSNLARHLGDTLAQAASNTANAGAFGSPGQKLVVLVGHETTQLGLAGLLGLEWRLPGTQRNPALLGGALVFELRQRAADQRWFVRVRYVSPTLDQTRTLAPLSLGQPPAGAPIFIPGCSEASPGFDAPLERFDALLRRVIDPLHTRSDAN